MRHRLCWLAVGFALVAGCVRSETQVATVTALGNEGFLVEVGDDSVVVDGLYEGLGGYVAPSEEQRRVRERAEPPFDVVDLALATHHHPDHFDAVVAGRFLEANRAALLVTTPMAVDLMRGDPGFEVISDRIRGVYPSEGATVRLDVGDIAVEVLNLHHGRGRSLPVENIGFVIDVNEVRLLHVGDTLATAAELEELELAARAVDLAFVPYWHLLDEETAAVYLEAVGATHVVAMHLPAADAPPSYLEPAEDLEGLIGIIREAAPDVVVFGAIMERRAILIGE